MNDFVDALKSRFNSPVFGYFGIALFAFNWKAIFFLLAQTGDVLPRITFFEQNTSAFSLTVWPGLFALGFSLLYPWLLLLVASLTSKPNVMKELIQVNSEHRLLIRRKQLEEARSSLLATTERELIERAKRDQELEGLQNEELRDRLRTELEQLRSERDSKREEKPSPMARHKELMDVAHAYRQRGAEAKTMSEEELFKQRARELEDQAHQLLMKSGIISGEN
jgi:hypothetical protein